MTVSRKDKWERFIQELILAQHLVQLNRILYLYKILIRSWNVFFGQWGIKHPPIRLLPFRKSWPWLNYPHDNVALKKEGANKGSALVGLRLSITKLTNMTFDMHLHHEITNFLTNNSNSKNSGLKNSPISNKLNLLFILLNV